MFFSLASRGELDSGNYFPISVRVMECCCFVAVEHSHLRFFSPSLKTLRCFGFRFSGLSGLHARTITEALDQRKAKAELALKDAVEVARSNAIDKCWQLAQTKITDMIGELGECVLDKAPVLALMRAAEVQRVLRMGGREV